MEMERVLNIIVTVKQLLDPEAPASTFKIDPETNQVIPAAGVPPVLNPDDESALEAALRVKELHQSRITAVSMGEKLAKPVLRRCLAAGADELILLEDDGLGELDGYCTAVVLAAAIRKVGEYDLVLAGRMAADTVAGQVGSGVAEALGIPGVTMARRVEIIDGVVRVERLLLDDCEVVEARLPALVTVSHELGQLREVPVRDLIAAQEKPVTTWKRDDLSLEQFPARRLETVKLYVPPREARCEIVEGETPEEAAVNLARKLKEAKIL